MVSVPFITPRSVKTKFFNIPQGVVKPLYGLYEYYPHFSDSDKLYFELWAKINPVENEIIICESCESMFDALSFSAVEKYAVSLKRLGNESQFMQLRDLPCRIFIHGTNNDEAGLKARKNDLHKEEKNINIFELSFRII